MATYTATQTVRRTRWTGERWFYTGMALAMILTVIVGFSRSFFLRPLFPDWPAPAERVFYVHGAVFAAWNVLLLVQTVLIGARRTEVHRKLGWAGVALAGAMIVLGTWGALVAGRRPTGFTGIPVPGLQFMAIPLFDMVIFGTFVALAVAARQRPQSHKRWMLLATINLLTAAIARWPGVISVGSPLLFFALTDIFIVILALWDRASRRRLHPVTLWGGLVTILAQPLRLMISGTDAWMAFARWATGLLG